MPRDSKTDSRLSFFFDNNVSKKLVAALKSLCPEHNLVHLQERFPADAPDDSWLEQLAREGNWIVVSGDYDLVAVPHVLKLIRENAVVAVVLKKGFTQLELYEYSAKIVKAWPDIVNRTRRSRSGDIWMLEVKALHLEKYQPPRG